VTPRVKLAAVFAGFVMAVSLSYAHPFGNPRSEPIQPREALLRDAHMPEEARRVLVTKCADCHSDTTRWPAYSFLAPGSWLIERDVAKGREHLNLSHWLKLSQDQRDVLSSEIAQQASRGTMPLPQYRAIHWGSTLTAAEVTSLSLLRANGPAGDDRVHEGDPMRGKSTFDRRCTGCHAVDADREGPRLRGAFGSRAASKPDFQYSDALKKAGIVWTDTTLERWLQDSDAIVPGNAMDFSVPRAQERTDIIAYLKTLQ
jgi:cytochrome c